MGIVDESMIRCDSRAMNITDPQETIDPILGLRPSEFPKGEAHLLSVVALEAVAIQMAREKIKRVCYERIDWHLLNLGIQYPGHTFRLLLDQEWHGDLIEVSPPMLFTKGGDSQPNSRLARQRFAELEALEDLIGVPPNIAEVYLQVVDIVSLMRAHDAA